jgi:type I restriction enzyme M protein
MISRMHPAPGANGDGGGEGSRIAIVYNGSPLFSGDAGSGPSSIRRWIIVYVENREFGFLKVTVERPLRMSFEATPERIARLDNQTAFANLAVSKKRKDKALAEREEAQGREQQEAIRALLATLESKGRYMDRAKLDADLSRGAKGADLKLPAPVRKAIFAALGERDPDAAICQDAKGRPEPDSELRDTENIPLPAGTALPLPMDFGPDKPIAQLVETFKATIDAYIASEVLPHVPDAWVDYEKTKVGYEIPINRHFYVYKPPRPLAEIEADIARLEGEIADLLQGFAG